MICRFCNQDMLYNYNSLLEREIIYCNNHDPIKVRYKLLSGVDKWFASYKE